MKKNNLIKFGTALLVTAIFGACSKEQKINISDQINIAQQLKFVPVNERIKEQDLTLSRAYFIIVSWNEWGRKSKNCDGWGLCDAVWFPEAKETVTNPNPTGGGASVLEFDHIKNKYYFDILLAAKPPASINATDLALVVDSDIVLETQSVIGANLKINQGIYYYDSSMRDYGGYRLYLNKL